MISFFVPGLPKPAGSKRAFKTKTGKMVLVDDSGKAGKNWRADAKEFARKAHNGVLLEAPLHVTMVFVMPRPKSHFRTGKHAGRIKESAPDCPNKKPDLTKLVRSVEDAMKGVLWKDDSQVCHQQNVKKYGGNPGVLVSVSEIRE